jgi:DNA-binding response OmpR family regulator
MAHVLVIEPDRQLAAILREMFELHGHTVKLSTGAQHAVFCIDEKQPDAVIVEVQLVGHSGVEFLYEMQSYPEWQHIPVIVHTTVPPTEFNCSVELMRDQLGVKQYCYKPHTSLRNLLRTTLEYIPATT